MDYMLKKFGAISLIIGAFLNTVRMIPIYWHEEIGLQDYPPHTLADTVEVAQLSGYYISHVMVFFATPFFLLGFYCLCKELSASNSNSLGQTGVNTGAQKGLTLAWIGFLIGQLFYTIGVVIHGLVLPEMTANYVAASAIDQTAMAPLFALNHHIATSFGGLGFAYLLVSTGVLGLFLRARFPFFGVIAILLGALALIGYFTGVLDLLLLSNFQITAGFVTLMFLFYLVVGISMLKEET